MKTTFKNEFVKPDTVELKKLSKRELEVLKLILTGKCNKEIAFQLCRSRRTIEDHRYHIMKKLSVNNVVELTKVGIKLGLTV